MRFLMFYRFTFCHRSLLLAIIFLLLTSCEGKKSETYSYPGNGFFAPFTTFARIKELESDLSRYAKKFPNARIINGVLFIENPKGFKLKLPKPIRDGEFDLRFNVSPKKGECIIGIGIVFFKVGTETISIIKKSKVIYNASYKNEMDIGISSSQNNLPCIIIQGQQIPEAVALGSPLTIYIELSDDFNGSIGPFTWVRGLP
jgi:hypothetical protein